MPLQTSDSLRLLALTSVPVAAVTDGFVGAALMLLVLGGSMVPRAWGLPTWLDLALGVVSLAAAWAALLDAYLHVPRLDLVVHALLTGVLALVASYLLLAWRWVPRRTVALVLGAVTAVALAALWEVGEYLGHTWLDDRIQVGYADTMTDLVAGVLGATVASGLGAALPRLSGGRQ